MDIELIHPDEGVLARRRRGRGGRPAGASTGGRRLAAGDRRRPPRGASGRNLGRVRGALVGLISLLLIVRAGYHYSRSISKSES